MRNALHRIEKNREKDMIASSYAICVVFTNVVVVSRIKSSALIRECHDRCRWRKPLSVFLCVAFKLIDDGFRSELIGIFEQAAAEGRKTDAEDERCVEQVRSVDDFFFETERRLFYHEQHGALHDLLCADMLSASGSCS